MHGGQTARGVIRRVVPSPALQWDPLAPETEIQSTLRNRFTGRKDLQRRLKELEAKRRSRDGPPGLRMSNAGDGSEKADKHPWHKASGEWCGRSVVGDKAAVVAVVRCCGRVDVGGTQMQRHSCDR